MLLLIVLLLPLMSLLLVVAAVLSTLVTVDLLHIGKDEAPNPLAWLLCILQLPLWYYTIKTIIIFSSIYLSAMSFLWKGTPSTAHNIHPIVKNEKSVQKKFAFAKNGGIVSDKGLETLAYSGCNSDIVGVTPGQLFYKSILGLSSGIFASTTISVFPARQALFVCAWKRRQKETKNCLTYRRAESCNKTCKANSPQKNSARISSAPSELSTTPAKKIHSCRHAAQTRWNLKCSRCGSMTQSKKSKRSGWKNGQKQLEWQQQSADSIAENHRIHKFLAFADRSDRGFYRPCQITQARSVFV